MKIDARNVIYLILEYVSEKNNSFDYQDISDECWKYIPKEQLDNLQKSLDDILSLAGLSAIKNIE